MRKETSTNFENQQYIEDTCGLLFAMEILRSRWTIHVLWTIYLGYDRYGEIKKLNPRISEKMLVHRLRDLQNNGLIVKSVHETIPRKATYGLTEMGRTLIPVLDKLCHWGQRHKTWSDN